MIKGTIILINDDNVYIMPEIDGHMDPHDEGLKIIINYLANDIKTIKGLLDIYHLILKNEYEVDDKYQKYQELKTKETNCLAINSDFVYVINNTNSNIDLLDWPNGGPIKKKTLTIYSHKSSIVIDRKDEYQIVLKDQEIKSLEKALDFYSRLLMGQYDHMVFELGLNAQKKMIDQEFMHALLLAIRKMTMPDLPNGIANHIHASYGIASPELDTNSKLSYEILKTIMHNRSFIEHPEGGTTVNFNEPLSVSGFPFPENETNKTGDNIVSTTKLKNYHIEPVINALNVYCCFLTLDMKAMFEYVSDNYIALSLADSLSSYLFSGFDINMINSFLEINNVRNKITNQIFDYDLFGFIGGH